jgi:uncharacterized protein with WD repeat
MPALGTMFDHKCKPLFNYGSGYRNTIKWSNSGRYVALCGFGNLPGDIGEIERAFAFAFSRAAASSKAFHFR